MVPPEWDTLIVKSMNFGTTENSHKYYTEKTIHYRKVWTKVIFNLIIQRNLAKKRF